MRLIEFVAADDLLFLLLARQAGRQAMGPAVMGELMAGLDIGHHRLRACCRSCGRA